MEIVDTKEGYFFKIMGNKTFAVPSDGKDAVFCPFCYNQVKKEDDKCPFCNKNIPEIIYFHGDDQTWIASGNE